MNEKDRPMPTNSVFKVNPVELKNYVQKFVEIITTDDNKLVGTVYTIDPISER